MITGEIAFDLPEPLVSEPFVIENFFSDEMYGRVKSAVDKLRLGPDGPHQYHTMIGRYESGISLSPDIEQYCLDKARELFSDQSLEKAYFYIVRYQKVNGCIPHLWEHTDQNGTQTTIDFTVENTADWDLVVEGNRYKQPNNSGVIFAGQQHWHARPPYPTDDESLYTTVIFMHFTQPDHWIQKETRGVHKYGKDGDVRFFNKNRFLPLPDPHLEQPVCDCHNYSYVVSLYNDIAGHAVDVAPENADMTMLENHELAPGIIQYRFSKESARLLRGLIHNACHYQWGAAKVYRDGQVVDKKVRNVATYFLGPRQAKCHPQDPLSRTYSSLEAGIEPFVADYSKRFSINGLRGGDWSLLRYETDNMYHQHYDASAQYPRVVSLVMYLNDDFDGGEIEFKEFGLKVKPEAGTLLLFPSSYIYMHEVHPVKYGIRYTVVRWYEY